MGGRYLPPQAPGGESPRRWDEPRPEEPPTQQHQPPQQPQPQPQWQPPPAYVRPPSTDNGQATASIVLGICGLGAFFLLGFGLLFFINLPCSILAWIFGVKGKRRAEQEQAGGRSLALAGQITGIVGTALGILGLVAWVLFFSLFDIGDLDTFDDGEELFPAHSGIALLFGKVALAVATGV